MLKTLADEVVDLLPALLVERPDGVPLTLIADRLGSDMFNIRNAALQINRDGKADLMRRLTSREWFLVPVKARKFEGYRFCAHCDREFVPPARKRSTGCTYYSNRRTCSRKCWGAHAWRDPNKAQTRKAAMSRAQRTPKALARVAAHNRRRWSDPKEHKKLSERNRQMWADPVQRALMSQAIAEVQGSPKMRKFYSDLRKRWWKIPEMRRKMCEAATRAKSTPEYRAYFSELCKKRWRDPIWRKKWMKAVRANGLKAAAAIRGKKQSPATIRKRVIATRHTKALRKVA